MRDQALPKPLADFLSQYISSVVQLELLLLLHSSAPRRWTSVQLAGELRIDPAWARAQADDLRNRDLVQSETGEEPVYWYDPARTPADGGVRALAEDYADWRVSIISFIYSRPQDQLKLFSDAFRIRKERPDG